MHEASLLFHGCHGATREAAFCMPCFDTSHLQADRKEPVCWPFAAELPPRALQLPMNEMIPGAMARIMM